MEVIVVHILRTGPNIYMPDPMLGDTVRSTKPKAPSFSMGGKTAQLSSDAVPFKTVYADCYVKLNVRHILIPPGK
jgi:hypothetical protein